MKKFLIGFLLLLSITIVSFSNLTGSNKIKAGVGDTIADTFPDANAAQGVADILASGDTNAIITQAMVNNTTALALNNKNISNIEGITVFQNLTNLQLNNNLLTSLPSDFGSLSSLVTLRLDYNQLASLPNSFGNLENLRWIYLLNNQLTNLPDSFGNLNSLEEISLQSNFLTTLPDSFTNLNSLHYLRLQDNILTSLPDNFGSLTSLEYLYLYNNQLTTLPDTLGNLSNLKTLSLYNNKLTTLPDSIVNLVKLEDLYLYTNQLTSLPDNFGNLSSLLWLFLFSNQLTSLPDSFANLNNLQGVTFNNNLLPTGFEAALPNISIPSGTTFDQLRLQGGIAPIDIRGQADLDNLDLVSMVTLQSQRSLSPSHEYILDGFVDENNDPIDLSDYISPSGAVLQEGRLFASIRATGTGLFPNNSDHAVTTDKLELNFKFTLYTATFDLNGGEGTAPDSQQVAEGELLTAVADPLRSGYIFKGWNTSIDGSGETWNFNTTTMPGEDITLYAIWEENTTGAEDNSIDKLPQTGMYASLIAGVMALVAGTGLILLTKETKKQ